MRAHRYTNRLVSSSIAHGMKFLQFFSSSKLQIHAPSQAPSASSVTQKQCCQVLGFLLLGECKNQACCQRECPQAPSACPLTFPSLSLCTGMNVPLLLGIKWGIK